MRKITNMKRKRKSNLKKKSPPKVMNTKDVDIITLLTADNASTKSSCDEVHLYKKQKDPVRTRYKKNRTIKQDDAMTTKSRPDILPSMSVRLTMGQHCEPYVYPRLEYKLPPLKGTLEGRRKRREMSEKGRRHFCKFEVVKMPSPLTTINLADNIMVESPRISHAGVMPKKTSVTKGALYPTPQTQSLLELHKPKSGAFINVTDDKPQLPPEKVLPIIRRPPKRHSILREHTLSALLEAEEDFYDEDFFMSGEEEEEIDIAAEEYLKGLRRKVSQTSAATSFNSRDLQLEEEVSWERIAVISKLVQTFRDENERDRKVKPKKRYKRGTLQSHSFTKLKQKTLPDICFKLISGTIHQGDSNYTEVSRNNQGICMPIAAYCYAQIYSPKYWSDVTIDDILDVGNRLYMDSIGTLHMHADQRDLKSCDLHKYAYIRDKKARFFVEQPDIVGYVRSTDKRVYNLTKGLKLFLQRNVAGILQASNLNVIVWKSGKKYLYFFDATARATDMCQERTGTAVLAKFSKLEALITVLLDRTDLGNSPFTISPIIVRKILGRTEKDEDVAEVHETSNYNILNENKAVVQASFDLGDKCFEFTRNKQAVPMSIIALIYTRITPACNWRKRTVDKIMMIGNQLYVECSEAENNVEINLEDIPSAFSIGPYAVEIFVYANLYTDLMYKKGFCEFSKSIIDFFDKNCNAIVQIGKHTIAIWQQRNMFFIFDPYTRNNEAFKCRSGTGCVSMLSNIENVIDIVTENFDNKDLIFRIHALKVLKINRDSQLSRLFPKGITMSEIPADVIKKTRIRRCKKKATEKPVQIQPSEYAMKKISAGDSPGPSIYEIDSKVQSITAGILPPLPLKLPEKSVLVKEAIEKELVAVLDSASLSDTQIEPDRPKPSNVEEEIMMIDLDSFDTTMDELEVQGEECEEEEDFIGGGDRKITYRMRSIFSQVKSISLDSYHKTRSQIINTDITYNYKILPVIELPIKQRPSEPKISKYYIPPEEELKKESNYADCDDGYQIICGSMNVGNYTSEGDRVAPFVCLFGIALHEEMPISKWRSKTIDFLLKSGKELYEQNNETYNRIDDYNLQFPENEYNITLELIMDTYVGNDLFTNSMGIAIIKNTLEASVFKKYNSAIIITPHYVCGILLFNSLYYLIDCFGGRECGPPEGEDDITGFAFVCRFKTIEDMIIKFMQIKNRRDNNASLEYVRFVICVPIIRSTSDPKSFAKKSGAIAPDGSLATVTTTQSKELQKPNNFLDLPDNSQILRGTSNIANHGDDVEFMAPFINIMATCVAEKYSVVTWSKEIVDYVLECGSELFKQSSVRFDQVSKIIIPKISLGSTDYTIEVDYLHDAVMKHANLEKSLSQNLTEDCEWLLIVTRYYACAVCVKNYLYYMYDPFGSNEVGYGEGLSNEGMASLQRFKDLHSMVMRILYNKNKREFEEIVEHTKYVLSACHVKFIPPEQEVKKRRGKDDASLDDYVQPEGDESAEEETKEDADQKKGKKKVNKIGYHRKKKFEVIQATNCLEDRDFSIGELKEDHFVCLVSLLNVITTSMSRWDTKRVDAVIDQGKQIYALAEDLNETNKRTIKNILIGSHLFDVIVKKIKIEDWKRNKSLDVGLNTVLRKRRFCIVQFENCSYAIYRDDEDVYHLFDPYGLKYKQGDEEEEEEEEEVEENADKSEDEDEDDDSPKTCWIKFKRLKDLKRYMYDNIVEGMEGYTFYSFAVMSVRPAPKDAILGHKLNLFDVNKRRKGDVIGKPFYEQETWIKMHQLPWSFSNNTTACGKPRHRRSSKWRNWDIEYPNDLYSLAGNIHQVDRIFDPENRGKQTLCNIIIAIGMTNIYELEKWNSSVLNSIVRMGNDYFDECIDGITEENYEIQIGDLKDTAKIPPFTFQIEIKPVVEGTMFLLNEKKFNLYKGLRYFFDHYETRCGIVCAIKGDTKKFLGFGKLQEDEYFVFDSQTYGMPMFDDRQGVAYALRCLKFNRLLHCLVTTLRGGDFYLFEVETYNFHMDADK